ncbi:aspartyl/glutamyl-tRNA amidotransferase subunit C [Corynebacterium renale]|uniref:Aspartyl/glutamyl-tRNA(Asn/Gln) amidotransferase subunit C n=1 Tax=Corynebacterium renale TaxID=1724 RepID=A0A2A9DR98_9CORY|nr:Asp-tRNA(Asn)/Glu-tRNA(Gln) amidotransferase subunit GatC [Corynebacterium renale]PFG28886.1 aspartyl/glutamyl-tRNA(Asn/Gln) amidotransferase subunit C [Corynebacterium renale]SQG64522.1 aspartyl/glutamyl-tRNA amidotransferase subunit C [Corynebacterium renale]SQI25624.1 aspartyl/glutamyl-tRNA amidotransferase subunit C [Corynebacterium renale]STC95486.1 aspartyl/glutamyl-tRNA amidotransferase subunit C [Corynebacterium renale]
MSDISREEVAHLAKLARLSLPEEELDQYAQQIDGIVATVAQVRQVDTEGVEPMSHPHSIATTMRADSARDVLTPEQALDQAPDAEDQRFVVPQILGE